MTPLGPDRSRPLGRRALAQRAGVLLAAALGGAPAAGEPVHVRTVPLGEVLKVPSYSAPATVVARNAPRLAAEIDARIVDITVEVGDRVAEGEVLVRLDCRRYASVLSAAQAARERADAQLEFARQQLSRARDLKRNRNISEELLDQRRTDLAAAEAALQSAGESAHQAAIDVENCEIRAPFDGAVTERAASVGDFASRGTVAIALIETEGQEVSVELRHEQVATLLAAEEVAFDSNGDRHPVRLRALLPTLDAVARTREARLAFTAEPAIAGSAGRLVWHGPRSLLPADYLVRRDGALGLFVLDGERARFVTLPQAQDGRPAQVGLAPQTRLITDGRQRLVDGDAVTPAGRGGSP